MTYFMDGNGHYAELSQVDMLKPDKWKDKLGYDLERQYYVTYSSMIRDDRNPEHLPIVFTIPEMPPDPYRIILCERIPEHTAQSIMACTIYERGWAEHLNDDVEELVIQYKLATVHRQMHLYHGEQHRELLKQKFPDGYHEDKKTGLLVANK